MSHPAVITPAALFVLLVLATLMASTIELNLGPLKMTLRKRRRRKRR